MPEEICEHGSQKRKCIICESYESDLLIADLNHQIEGFKDYILRNQKTLADDTAASENGLLCCPFCGGNADWCGEHDKEDIHQCHFIVCVGDCKAQFDMTCDIEDAEELDDLKKAAITRFNRRAI